MGAPQYEQAGADIGGTGTTNTIPRWTGPSTLGDSGLIDNGTAIYTTTRNVGFGTASPSTRLHVSDNSSIPMIVQSSGSTDSYLRFINTANNLGYIGYVGTNLYLAPNNGAGNVGIGTVSPLARLHSFISGAAPLVAAGGDPISGSIIEGPNTALTSGAGSLQPFAVLTNDTQAVDRGGGILFGGKWTNAGNSFAYFGGVKAGKENSTSAEYGGYLAFYSRTNGATGLAERARIDSSGNLILNTANTGATIQAAGTSQGLKLPATPGNADAQTLDCYQENPLATTAGNGWTPTIGGTAAQWGGTLPTVSFARYVQIGSIVFCDVRLTSASIQSTYGVTTITPPPPAQNAFATEVVVPASTTSGGVTGNGAQFGGVVYLPTLAASTAIRLTWFYFTTS